MGVEYYAINKQNKTFYDLGKGGWYGLTDMEAFQDEEYLCHEILIECFNVDEEDDWRSAKDKEWIVNHVKTRVGPDLFHMMKDTPPDKIKIVNDCGDDITICRSKGYRGVGTRYHAPDSPEHKQAVQFLNRHMDVNGNVTRYYGSDLKTIPGYDEY